MTEPYMGYQAGRQPSREAFRQRPCCYPYHDVRFEHPTPQDVRDLVALTGWSQSTLAELVGVGYEAKGGSTTIRKWKTSSRSDNARRIPYAAWRLLLLVANLATLEDDRAGAGL